MQQQTSRKKRCQDFAGAWNMCPLTAAGGNTRIVSPRHKPAKSISEFSIQERQRGAAMRGTVNRPDFAGNTRPAACRNGRRTGSGRFASKWENQIEKDA
ncbi:MAG TPA: hypothetical protein VGH23_15860 [Rhizomicrobium sp.]|jgi:hypothetical protein